MNNRLKKRHNRRKLLIFLAVIILLTGLGWYVNQHSSLEELVVHENRIRNFIADNPWQSFGIGFGIYFSLSLVPGTGGKGMVYGWLFGFWQAVFIVTVGLTLAGMVIFSLSRYLFRDSIERRYAAFISLMNQHIEREGAFYLLTLRMAHAPYSIVNPVSGATRVRLWTFCWTTVVGLLPANAIWVYAGERLPSLQELANNGPGSLIDAPLITALVSCALLPPVVRWLVRRYGIPARENPSSYHEARKEMK